ncbi:hypothetical protein [Spongiivirga citrea]|uniref:DUF1080 domain-containing protein n=1 Tax=Spongiivirga citrea TaxID=1481457 RepID=A0A6M0CHD3_9FLAO|nr:hypothetical protein [Spongiivirga citrea]NER17348.1 hypothetical protein [Spongiivirga citrea]
MMYKSGQFLILVFLMVLESNALMAQTINIGTKQNEKKIRAVNRTINIDKTDKEAIVFNAQEGDGLGVLEDQSFKHGTLTLSIKGENKPGRSFVGFAFNIQNDSVYEAIYFRPFNFVAKEPVRKSHMVQYIYHPEFTWRKLREERTDEFENEIMNPPNPEEWFKTMIKIEENHVTVFVNDSKEPSLKVKRLTKTKSDKVGLWTGFNSAGKFKDLEFITIKK